MDRLIDEQKKFPILHTCIHGSNDPLSVVVSGMVYLPLDHVVQPSELAQDEVRHLMVLPRPHTTGSGNEEWE